MTQLAGSLMEVLYFDFILCMFVIDNLLSTSIDEYFKTNPFCRCNGDTSCTKSISKNFYILFNRLITYGVSAK